MWAFSFCLKSLMSSQEEVCVCVCVCVCVHVGVIIEKLLIEMLKGAEGNSYYPCPQTGDPTL